MIDAIYAFAVLMALVGLVREPRGPEWFACSRTALALLASVTVNSVFLLTNTPFSIVQATVIDLITACLIFVPAILDLRFRWREAFILALFLPAQVLYYIGGWPSYYGTSAIVALQLLLTYPLPQLAERYRSWRSRQGEDDAMKRIAHA